MNFYAFLDMAVCVISNVFVTLFNAQKKIAEKGAHLFSRSICL